MKEIPTYDKLVGMIYTKWSDQHPRRKLTDEIGKQIQAAAHDTHLQLQGLVKAGLTPTEAMIEVRSTMYPPNLMK